MLCLVFKLIITPQLMTSDGDSLWVGTFQPCHSFPVGVPTLDFNRSSLEQEYILIRSMLLELSCVFRLIGKPSHSGWYKVSNQHLLPYLLWPLHVVNCTQDFFLLPFHSRFLLTEKSDLWSARGGSCLFSDLWTTAAPPGCFWINLCL